MRILTVFLLLAAALAAQTLQIVTPATSQVLQRGTSGKTDIIVSGTATDADGKAVEARLVRGIVPVFGFTTKKYGAVEGGKFNFTMGGVPTGGPYKLEVKLTGTKTSETVDPLFVGDVWVLAGQSNMEGVGDLVNVQPPDDKVRTFDMVQEKWQLAREPLHNLPGSVDRVHWRLNAEKQPERFTGTKLDEFNTSRKKGAGLGLPFGAAYVKAADVPVGLVPCAHGGTSMNQWDPALWDKEKPGDSLYGSMMRRVQASGGKVKGVLWYQGESDSGPTVAPLFKEKFSRFIARVRGDLAEPELPFYFVQIGRFTNLQNEPSWNLVQEVQRQLGTELVNATVFASVDSDLDDGIHVSTTDLKRIGENMAKFAAGKAKRGPSFMNASIEGQTIRVQYSDVNGKLATRDRLYGFSIHGSGGEALPMVFKQEIDPFKPTSVLVHFQGKLPEGATLSYGNGKNPYCNLRDEMGFGAPVFGPVPLK